MLFRPLGSIIPTSMWKKRRRAIWEIFFNVFFDNQKQKYFYLTEAINELLITEVAINPLTKFLHLHFLIAHSSVTLSWHAWKYKETRMTTSISSKAFCNLTDRPTDKIFTEWMLIYEGNLHKKNWSDISIRGWENHIYP